jgi:putative aminopeptidase FrvX
MSKHFWDDVLDSTMMEEFVQADGIAANEKEVSRVMRKYVEADVDEVVYDGLGSVAFYKKGSEDVTIMLAGHIDEIGFLINNIDDDGFIKLHPVGGWWPHVLLGSLLTITTEEGKKYTGVVGSMAPHGMKPEVRKNVMDLKDVFLDIGVTTKQEVLDLGIQIGDMITPRSEFVTLANPNFIAAKAWDDRIGALIVAQIMRNLKGKSTKATIVGVGTVQEEVGLRGAKTAAYMIDPDIAITLDVTVADDTPKGDKRIILGKGITLEVADSSHFGHKGLLTHLKALAKEMKFDVQLELLAAGGTDSGEIHKSKSGVMAITVSIPSRYIHSHYALIHKKDVAETIELLTRFVAEMDLTTFKKLNNKE